MMEKLHCLLLCLGFNITLIPPSPLALTTNFVIPPVSIIPLIIAQLLPPDTV